MPTIGHNPPSKPCWACNPRHRKTGQNRNPLIRHNFAHHPTPWRRDTPAKTETAFPNRAAAAITRPAIEIITFTSDGIRRSPPPRPSAGRSKEPNDADCANHPAASPLNYATTQETAQRPAPDAPGLHYLPRFLTAEQQAEIISRLDSAEWNNDLRRRVQQYGWRYDYRARAITPDMYLGALPEWPQTLARQVHGATGLFDRVPEQVIVNEYRGAQGIAEHGDHPGFGPAIATVSLLADWEMNFAPRYRQPPWPALLENGSCLTRTGLSRSRWTHCIPARRDEPDSRRRGRRIPLTFRTVRNCDGQNG